MTDGGSASGLGGRAPGAPPDPPPLGTAGERRLQRILAGLWTGAIPALLAIAILRFCVPPAGVGVVGAVAYIGRRFPIPLGVALFFVLSALARYWRFRIPGGRYASALPARAVPHERSADRLAAWAADAALYAVMVSAAMHRRSDKTFDPERRSAIDDRLRDLRSAFEAGDGARARGAADAITTLAGDALVARRRREAIMTAGAAALAIVVAFGVRASIGEPYEVLSASMLPTLEPGDRVGGNKLAYGGERAPKRGDVVVFQSKAVGLPPGFAAPEVLVKRVIGLPGDRVSMTNGQPVINGWPVPSCDAGQYVFMQSEGRGGAVHGRLRVEFIDDRAYVTVNAMSAPFRETYEVKPGEVFVLGDNRGNSLDSRAWNDGHGGGVPIAAVDARVQWFLVGAHRSGDADFGRFGRAIGGLEGRLRLEGVDSKLLADGIARCLSNRPSETSPPPSSQTSAARAIQEADR